MTNNRQSVPPSVGARSVVVATLAVVLALEIGGIATYGYWRVQSLLEPSNLANRVESAIQENYPEYRQQLIAQVKQQSPAIAEQVSRELIKTMPGARQQLEQFTARQLDAGLEEVTELSVDNFREALRENRERMISVFEKIEAAPQEARQLVLETESSIEKQLGIDLQKQAKQVLAFHQGLNEKLERLVDADADFSSQELIERRIVRILRTLQTADSSNGRLSASGISSTLR